MDIDLIRTGVLANARDTGWGHECDDTERGSIVDEWTRAGTTVTAFWTTDGEVAQWSHGLIERAGDTEHVPDAETVLAALRQPPGP